MDVTHPVATIRKVEPICRSCGADRDLIRGDGPPVCRACIKQAGVMGQATVRRSDTRSHDDRAREGWR